MLDILSSPLRGYIAQTLQFYLSKYIEGIALEGLGLFGGDLVLNDLEIKRHVLVESLEIPSSFDFSRGFIRELRIHIPWTQLLSQPIEVKLYTIELILTACDESHEAATTRRASRSRSVESASARDALAPEIEAPKAGWLRETLHKILANITIQINNLVLKYEQDDMVLSVALGTLDCYTVNDRKGWLRGFTEPHGASQVIARGIDARDLTIFLDRYTSDRKTSDPRQRGAIHRRVVGYELPVLSRSTISVRARMCLKPGADQDEITVAKAIHRKNATFAHVPSKACDPFFQYSCVRQSIVPSTEIDIFVRELTFSLSDRQLLMLGELLNRTMRGRPTTDTKAFAVSDGVATKLLFHPSTQDDHYEDGNSTLKQATAAATSVEEPEGNVMRIKQTQTDAKKRSWVSWAMEALGGPQDGEEDELIAEILAETKEALRRASGNNKQSDATAGQVKKSVDSSAAELHQSQPVSRTMCCRVCINSAALTLRRHEEGDSATPTTVTPEEAADEQFVPVANIGLVKVSNRPSAKAKQSKAASEVCTLSLAYSAMEVIISRDGDEDLKDSLTDVVFEVERVKMVYSHNGNAEDGARQMVSWGTVLDGAQGHGSSSAPLSDCVSHPYFVSTFFGEAARDQGRRESRSFEIVKVSQDLEVPVWKTIDRRKSSHALSFSTDPTTCCRCSLMVQGKQTPCVPLSRLISVSKDAVTSIGIRDRNLDQVNLRAALEYAWGKHCQEYHFDTIGMTEDLREVCETYQSMRDPDSSAAKNLNQLLAPSLCKLLARYTLHHCYLVNADIMSTIGVTDVRARSLHSAVRIRYVGAKSSSTNEISMSESERKLQDLPAPRLTNTRVRTSLDASLGPLEIIFEPMQVNSVISLLSAVIKKDDEIVNSNKLPDTFKSTNEPEPSDCQSSHLVTFHSVVASITPFEENPACSLVKLDAQDFSWFASRSPVSAEGGRTRRIQLGRGCIHVSPKSSLSARSRVNDKLIEVIGFRLESSDEAGVIAETTSTVSVGKASAILDWNGVWFSACAIDEIIRSAGWRTFGFESRHFDPLCQRHFAYLEICDWRLDRTTKTPREGSADRVMEVSCGSWVLLTGRKSVEPKEQALEVGCTPLTSPISANGAHARMLWFRFQESKSRQHSYVDVQGQIATIVLAADCLARCAPDAFTFLQRVNSRHSVAQESTGKDQPAHVVESKAKYWNIVVTLQCAGAVVHLTPALELSIAPVTITSDPSLHSNRRAAIEPGGSVRVLFNCNYLLLVNKWKAPSVPGSTSDRCVVIHTTGLSGSVLYSQDLVSSFNRTVIDSSVQLGGVQVALDKLSVRHLARVWSILPRLSGMPNTPDSNVPSRGSKKQKETNQHRSIRVGLLLNSVKVSTESNILEESFRPTQPVSVATLFHAQLVTFAFRNATYRPKIDFADESGQVFTDVQLSIASIEASEEHRQWMWSGDTQPGHRRFGTLARLSDRDFLDVLLCLDGRDLAQVTKALEFEASTPASLEKQSVIAAWQSVNRLAHFYRQWSEAAPARSDRLVLQSLRSFPVLAAASTTIPTGSNVQPVLAAFYRNYGDNRQAPKLVIAASLEDVDLVITPTGVTSIAALSEFEDDSTRLNRNVSRPSDSRGNVKTQSQRLPDTTKAVSDQAISVITGRIRVFLPDRHWIESFATVAGNQPGKAPPPCASLFLDHATVSSATWQELSLDGLGYPPFDAALLPRRISRPLQLRRITSDATVDTGTMRRTSRLGNISGAMVQWLASESAESSDGGPLDAQLSRVLKSRVVGHESEAFVRHFSVVIESSKDLDLTSSSEISVTKIRSEVSKPLFDQLVQRAADISHAVLAAQGSDRDRSMGTDTPVDGEQTQASPREKTSHKLVVTCDGLDFVAAQDTSSIHVRVGSLLAQQSSTGGADTSGTFSVQNVVVALRHPQGGGATTTEELVLGPNSDPCIWQLDVDNAPHKLISGRWTTSPAADTPSESFIFVDVQGVQVNVSSHCLDEALAYLRPRKSSAFVIRRGTSTAHSTRRELSQPRHVLDVRRQRKVGVKVLLGPSMGSYWIRQEQSQLGAAVCLEIDQVFTSIEKANHDDKTVSDLGQQHVKTINRFVVAPGFGVTATIDKLIARTSSSFIPLTVRFKTETLSAIPGHIQSSWVVFSKSMSQRSARTTLLQESTIRITGSRSTVAERSHNGVVFATPISLTSVQIDPSSLSFKISAASLASLSSFVDAHARSQRQRPATELPEDRSRALYPSSKSSEWIADFAECSNDDLAALSHRTEQTLSPPRPGDVVFSEALLVETVVGPAHVLDTDHLDLVIDFEPSRAIQPADRDDGGTHPYDETAEVLHWIELVNEPWNAVDTAGIMDESVAPHAALSDTQTTSWMSMKWCYHLPRRIVEITMEPVPVPPAGVPTDWPVWFWKEDQDAAQDDRYVRLCDIVCELRVWDAVKRCYVKLADFLVPWESSTDERLKAQTLETKRSFGDLMSVFFDGDSDDEEQAKFARVLDVTCCRRVLKLRNLPASDKWELRWRSPLSGEQDKQQRVLVSALLAASLNVRSQLVESAIQRVDIQCGLPLVSIAAAFVQGNDDASHDIITASLNETLLSVVSYAGDGGSKIVFKSELQVAFENLAQLLTVPVVPRVELHGMINRNAHAGTQVSVALGDAHVYLPQSAILLLTSLSDILKSRAPHSDTAASTLPVLRIQLVNASGTDIRYRQCGSRECLPLRAGEHQAYSWLTLEGDPSYDYLQFALDSNRRSATEAAGWCDPCGVREGIVTARYFQNHGFLWVSVERCGTVTTVYLRGTFNVINCLQDFVHLSSQPESDAHNRTVIDCRSTSDPMLALKCLQEDETATSSNLKPSMSRGLDRVGFIADSAASTLRLGMKYGRFDSAQASTVSSQMVRVQDLADEFEPYDAKSDEISRSRCRSWLTLEGPSESDKADRTTSKFVVVEVVRAVQPTTMPNDFVYERIVPRHTWIDIYVLPSLQVVNLCAEPLFIGLYTKGEDPEDISIGAHETVFCSAVDPTSLRAVTLQLPSGEVSASCSIDCEVPSGNYQLGSVSFELVPPSSTRPMYQIRFRRHLVVINKTNLALQMKIGFPDKEAQAEPAQHKSPVSIVRLDPGTETSPGALEAPTTDRFVVSSVVLSVAQLKKGLRHVGASDSYSLETALALKAGSKAIMCCPAARPEGEPEDSAECDLSYPLVAVVDVASCGSIRVVVSTLVTVHNDTGLRLKFSSSSPLASSAECVDHGDTWGVPIRRAHELDKSRVGSGVTSWISSALGFGAKTRASSFAIGSTNPGATTCAFQVSVSSDDTEDCVYDWAAEIPIRVPELSHAGKSSRVTLPSLAYPPPSSVSARHRRLVRHSGMRHVLLTITTCQLDDTTIHVLIFVDRQTPLAIENTWSYPIGIRAISAHVMTPDAVAGHHYMEYDWSVQRRSTAKKSRPHDGANSLDSWLAESAKAFEGESASNSNQQPAASGKFQLGLPGFGWSNVLWQVSGIQFARFATSSSVQSPVFLVAVTYRAGTWFISISCLDDPSSPPSLIGSSQRLESQSAACEDVVPVSHENRFRLVVSSELVSIHCCDEHTIIPTERAGSNAVAYKEIFRLVLRSPCVSFISTTEAPASMQSEARLGYMKHVRAYNLLYVGLERLDIEHNLETCNFPVMLSVTHTSDGRDDAKLPVFRADMITAHDEHRLLLSDLMAVELPESNSRYLALRIINVTPWEQAKVPSYYKSVQLRLAPAIIQVDDEILAHVHAFVRPITSALSAAQLQRSLSTDSPQGPEWRALILQRIRVMSQQRVYIDELDVSDLVVTVTARMSIPVLNSLDGTPLRFSARNMRRVFAFSDQLAKDLAAEYVADVLVRSPMLLMSLNIIGNPAGFVRSVGAGVRDLFEIPITVATRDGFNPWILTRGIFSGIASLVGHTSAAALSSLSGFTYSISRTVDHLTLTPDQLRRQHYVRPTHLTSGITGGLGSLGSSVVGAATGVVRTPIALYQEKRQRGMRAGVGDVVGGLSMGLVGIVARPMGGLASLLSMTSDGILNGTGMGEHMPKDEDKLSLLGKATFEARPNDELRAKLKILRDPSVGDLVLAHGAWVDASEALLLTPLERLRQLTPTDMDDDRVRALFSDKDRALVTIVVSVVCTRSTLFVVGIGSSESTTGSPLYEIVAKTPLVDIHTIEESLSEPARLDIGVRSSQQSAWYRLRLAPAQRRHLSHSLRKWYEEAHGRGLAAP